MGTQKDGGEENAADKWFALQREFYVNVGKSLGDQVYNLTHSPYLPSRTLRYRSVTFAYCSFFALFDLESGGQKRASLEKVNKQTNTSDTLILAEYRLCWCG